MIDIPTPELRPLNPCFSSGPCAKRPGYTVDALKGALLGRNHRAAETKARITEVIDRSRALLGMPADWRLGVVPASDTGAMEIALWSLLGPRPVDILTFESFGTGWATDILRQLKLPDARVLAALSFLNDEATRYAVTVERAALAALGGGCQVPIGIHCFEGDEGYSVVSAVAAVDGAEVLRVVMDRQRDVEAETLGRKVAAELLRQGAARLLGSEAAMGSAPGSAPVGAA